MFVREFRTTEVGVVLELLRIAGYNSKQLAFALCATPGDIRKVNSKWFAGKRAASITEELWGSSGEKNCWRDLLMKVSKANKMATFNRLNVGRRMPEDARLGEYTREEILSCILALGECPGAGSFTKRIAGAPAGETPYTWGLRKEVTVDPFWSTVTVDEVVEVVSTVKAKVKVFLEEIAKGLAEAAAAKKAEVSLKAVEHWRGKIEARRAKNSPAEEARRLQKLKEGFRPLSARIDAEEIDTEESICRVVEIREFVHPELAETTSTSTGRPAVLGVSGESVCSIIKNETDNVQLRMMELEELTKGLDPSSVSKLTNEIRISFVNEMNSVIAAAQAAITSVQQ